MNEQMIKRLRRNNEEWEKVRDENKYFETRVWEVVHPIYDEEANETTIKYRKYVNKNEVRTDEITSREWTLICDARPRLDDAGYLGSIIVSSSGTYEEWIRQSFDFLASYQ